MKKALTVCLFTCLLLASSISNAVPMRINAVPSDYTNALTWEQAQKINKPIVLEFYVDWCGYCKKFAPVLYSLNQEYGSKYSFVYINGDDPKNQRIMNSYKIEAYPTLFLVDKKRNKKIVVSSEKYESPKALKQELDKFLK
jgi:thioredoxin 1